MTGRALLIAGLFLLPNLLGFLAFTFLPAITSLGLSFCTWDPVAQSTSEISPAGLQNYTELLGFQEATDADPDQRVVTRSPRFWESLYNSLFLMLAIPFTIAGSLLLAVLLNQKIRGRVFFRTMFFLPSISAGVGTLLLWQVMFNADNGMVNRTLALAGIPGPEWLTSYTWAKPALMVMGFWTSVGGINVILYLAGLQGIPRELFEAAAIDGASWWRRLWHITVPMLTPVTFFIFIISVIGGLQGEFDASFVMTGGRYGTTTMSLYIYQQAFEYFRMGFASAAAWILFVIVFVVTVINWHVAERRVEY